MKLIFWDFDEEYNHAFTGEFICGYDGEIETSFIKNNSNSPRRDFFDHFYDQGIDDLIEDFPNLYHGVVTNGDLNMQIRTLRKNRIGELFDPDLCTSPIFEAKSSMELPDGFILKYKKNPFSYDFEKDSWDLILSLNKPNPYMYDIISRTVGVDPEDCFVIGTNHRDFLAGKKAGMKTVHIRGWENDGKFNVRNYGEKPDYTINKSNMYYGLEKIFNNLK